MACLGLLATAAISFSTAALADEGDKKIKIEAGCTCSDPLSGNRCKVKNLTCPAKAEPEGDASLTNFIQTTETKYAAGEAPSPQVTYGRLKFTLEGASGIQGALTDKNSFWRRFKPEAKGIMLSVGASSAGGVVLPTSPMLSLEIPTPEVAENKRVQSVSQNVVTPWIRIDTNTQLKPTFTFDTVSSSKIQFFGGVVSNIASIASTLTGKNLLVGTADLAVQQTGAAIDQQLTYLVDPDGRDKRTYTNDGLIFSPAQGGRKKVALKIGDTKKAGEAVATLTIEVELIPSLLLPQPQTSGAEAAKLQTVDIGSKIKETPGIPVTGAPPKAYSQTAEYKAFKLDIDNVSGSAVQVVQKCQAFQSDAQQQWSFVPIDANLMIFETLVARSQVPGVSPELLRGASSCFSATEKAALKTLGRELPAPPVAEVFASPLSIPHLDAIGARLIQDTALSSAVAADFDDVVEVTSDSDQWGFEGVVSGDRDAALSTIAGPAPVRRCCYDLTKKGTSTIILDIGPAGEKTTPMAVDLQTVGKPKIGRVALRKPTEAEVKKAAEKWTSPAPKPAAAPAPAPPAPAPARPAAPVHPAAPAANTTSGTPH